MPTDLDPATDSSLSERLRIACLSPRMIPYLCATKGDKKVVLTTL